MMPGAERIHTLHPDPTKAGVAISAKKYAVVRDAMRRVLLKGDCSFSALAKAVVAAIGGSFEGSVPWYVVTVKLDLEARGELERVPGTRPQMLRLTGR